VLVAEEAIPAEAIPDVSADELMARKFVHRIRRLRWMGMEDAARALEMELRNAPFASTVVVAHGERVIEVAD
jgi:hypothetical protein